MSFLTRSKLDLSETSSTLLSRIDDKSKFVPSSHQKASLMTSLDDFRQGLRRQLTDKLKTNPPEVNSTNKFVGIPSPKRNQSSSIKDLFESTLGSKQRNSPSKNGITLSGRPSSALNVKPLERKNDFVKELTKKLEERSSPHKRLPSQEIKLTSALDKRVNSPTALLSSGYRTSFDKREKSPLKGYASALDFKSPSNRRTPYDMKSSFLNDRSLNYTPKDSKQSLIKILDHSTTPKIDSPSNFGSDRSNIKLSQQLNQLRSSRILLQTQTPEKKEDKIFASNRYSTDNLKTLTNFVNDSFKQRDRERSAENYGTKKSSLYTSSSDNLGNNQDKSSTSGKLSLTKICELQDTFYNMSDKEFNQLSPDYVEELIKLSSVIMQRVKGSAYYSKE